MSKRICFSSVLRQKRGSQHVINKPPNLNSLQEIMEEFMMYPNRDYTLRYFQSNSLRACNSKQGFQDGFNQLDHWIHNQIQNSNKQNISDTQPRRQIPNELLKFANAGSKSPRKVNQGKLQHSGFQQQPQPQPHRNIDMKQICREYVENKRVGKDLEKDGPVWRFGQKNEEYYEQQNQGYTKMKVPKQSGGIIRQSSNTNKFKQQRRLNQRQEENYNQQVQKPKQEKLNRISTQREIRSQQSSNLIQEIKNNLAHDIQVISERIIQDRKLDQEEDQELLISQRQSQEYKEQVREQFRDQIKDQMRQQNARKVIAECLGIKNGGISSDHTEKQQKQPTSEPPIPKKQGSKIFNQQSMVSQKNQERNSASGTQNVGYSFSNDFVINTNNQGSSIQRQQNRSQQSMQKNKRQNESNLSQNSRISLPNIDQVKSQRDAYQKVEDDFVQSRAVNVKAASRQENQSIDKNYIKQIQSVAYGDQNQGFQRQQAKVQRFVQREPRKQTTELNEKKPGSCLLQQVNKQVTSIQNWQDNSVVISVAQKSNQARSNGGSNQGSAKERAIQKPIQPAHRIQSFVAPANQVRIQFKKIPSPQRQQKVETKIELNSSSTNNNIGSHFKNSIPVHYHASSISINGTPIQKNSISNLLLPAEVQPNHQPTKTSISSNKPLITVGSSFAQNMQTIQAAQTAQTSQTVQAINVQSSLSSNMQIHNSRERNGSNNDEGRKLRITISPKYNGIQTDKNELTAPTVGDFRIGATRMQQSSQGNKFHTPSPYQPPQSSQIPTKVSFTHALNSQANLMQPLAQPSTKQSINSNKFRVDTMFSNVNNVFVAQKREIIEQVRQKDRQNAMIRVQKYEKTETIVDPPKSNKASISRNKQSIKSSQQFEFDLDF